MMIFYMYDKSLVPTIKTSYVNAYRICNKASIMQIHTNDLLYKEDSLLYYCALFSVSVHTAC